MDYGLHIQGTASITAAASGTATIVAAQGSGLRLHLSKGYVSVAYSSNTAAAAISLIETETTGSDYSVIFGWTATTHSVYNFDFGDKGYYLSSANSRLAIMQSAADATCHAVVTGYIR